MKNLSGGTRLLVIGTIVGILALFCVCLACIGLGGAGIYGILGLTQPVADAGDNFFIEIKEGDYATAYEMISDSWREELGSAENLGIVFADRQPQDWSFTSRSMDGDTGYLFGSMTDKEGDETSIALNLVQDGDQWRVSSIEFNAVFVE
jgi:hypothetical protein